MTKGAFFYHFKTKSDLARALIDRWSEGDQSDLSETMQRAEKGPPKAEVELESLGDLVTVLLEGAFTLSRVVREPGVFSSKLRHHRNYLQLLFGE